MSDDDYMSDALLNQIPDDRPGVARSRTQQRALNLAKSRSDNEFKMRAIPKKSELEHMRRVEALSKPVGAETKGFKLMEKMGFKAGMTLGKKKDANDMGSGIAEPLPIEMKTNRTGLGHDTKMNVERKERFEAELKRMEFRAKHSEQLMKMYRRRKLDEHSTKKTLHELYSCRKLCYEFDSRIELRVPVKAWYWRGYAEKSLDALPESVTRGVKLPERYIYANGVQLPEEEPEPDFGEMDISELEERIIDLSTYLRTRHNYCIWCKAVYESPEELAQSCPGQSRDDHDLDTEEL